MQIVKFRPLDAAAAAPPLLLLLKFELNHHGANIARERNALIFYILSNTQYLFLCQKKKEVLVQLFGLFIRLGNFDTNARSQNVENSTKSAVYIVEANLIN